MSKLFAFLFVAFFLCASFSSLIGDETLVLRQSLRNAESGDYVVLSRNQNHTMLWIRQKQGDKLMIEEISIPSSKRAKSNVSWRDWMNQGAPLHTGWVRYEVDLNSGEILSFYSLLQRSYIEIPPDENIFSSLINLKFKRVPLRERRRLGAREKTGSFDDQQLWNPRLVVDGEVVEGVSFDVWKTRWPKDGSELSDKVVEIYLPPESADFPSYFPYWLQLTGLVTKAKMRVIDSGKGLFSVDKCSTKKASSNDGEDERV